MTIEQRNAVQAVLKAVSDALKSGLTKRHIIVTAAMKRNRPCILDCDQAPSRHIHA